jgi:hypothetical protein
MTDSAFDDSAIVKLFSGLLAHGRQLALPNRRRSTSVRSSESRSLSPSPLRGAT